MRRQRPVHVEYIVVQYALIQNDIASLNLVCYAGKWSNFGSFAPLDFNERISEAIPNKVIKLCSRHSMAILACEMETIFRTPKMESTVWDGWRSGGEVESMNASNDIWSHKKLWFLLNKKSLGWTDSYKFHNLLDSKLSKKKKKWKEEDGIQNDGAFERWYITDRGVSLCVCVRQARPGPLAIKQW